MSVLNTMIQDRVAYAGLHRSRIRHRHILTAFNYIVLIASAVIVYTHYSEIMEFLHALVKTIQ